MINKAHLEANLQQRARDLGLRYQVGMDGDINAEYIIIGEGPGQEEVNQKLPFVGGTGRELWNSLRPFGLLRTKFYITNVCKRQISVAKNTRYPILADEWIKWKHLLQYEIDQLPNAKYILCLGNAGLEALFGHTGITDHRGSVYTYKDKQVLCAYNPAHVLRDPKLAIVLLMDCRRFRDLTNGDWKPYNITKHINPSYEDARAWIAEMRTSTAPVSYDIESVSGATACHGLGNNAHEAMCINLRDRVSNRFTAEQELQLLFDLQDMFDKQKVIAQNGNFDAHWTGYMDLLHVRNGFDTMLAHHTLYPLLPHNLGFITAQYTTHPYYKDDIKEWKEGGDIDTFWQYNCTDVAVTWEAARLMQQELKDQKLDDFFHNHVMRLDPWLVRSTVDGFAVDQSVKSEIAAKMAVDVRAIEDAFHKLVQAELRVDESYRPNIRSNAQMRNLFLERLKLHSTTGSVSKPDREKMINDPRTSMSQKDIINKYDEYQRENKFFNTYAEMRVDPDNRFRTTWKQQGVTKAPGRLSSAGNLWGTASNAQNQSGRSQKFFIADHRSGCKSTVIIYIDGSQAEARVVALLADIDKWKEDFERARLTGTFDAHRSLAADMYHIPYDDVPTDDWVLDPATGLEVPTIRYKAKRARHGLNYRMGYPRLAEAAKLSMFEAKKTYVLYHQTNPEIKVWWADVEKEARTKRELWSPLGRRFKLIQRIDDEALESVVAFTPQSTIGDHVRRVWYKSSEDDLWDNSRMRIRFNVHDALIGLAHPDYALSALRIMKKHMEEPLLIQNAKHTKAEQIIIPGDVAMSVGGEEDGIHRWSTLKKLKGFKLTEDLPDFRPEVNTSLPTLDLNP